MIFVKSLLFLLLLFPIVAFGVLAFGAVALALHGIVAYKRPTMFENPYRAKGKDFHANFIMLPGIWVVPIYAAIVWSILTYYFTASHEMTRLNAMCVSAVVIYVLWKFERVIWLSAWDKFMDSWGIFKIVKSGRRNELISARQNLAREVRESKK
jgi:hypothetical protein